MKWEFFSIGEVKPTNLITYILKDVKGGFYKHELQKTNHRDIYLVDKILKREGMLFTWSSQIHIHYFQTK